jgi:hypothetical protein
MNSNTGVDNGGSVLKNIIPNFFSVEELDAVWYEFNTNPRWQYRRMSGGQWFWWYMFLGQNQFVANNQEQWKNCTAPIWRELYDRVCNLAGDKFIPYRYIINGQTEGQQGHPHSDFGRNLENRSTFLAYLNQEWQPQWEGDTVFFHNRSIKERERVTPASGLLIEYDSRIVHKGNPPVVPNVLRVTLAIQGEYA